MFANTYSGYNRYRREEKVGIVEKKRFREITKLSSKNANKIEHMQHYNDTEIDKKKTQSSHTGQFKYPPCPGFLGGLGGVSVGIQLGQLLLQRLGGTARARLGHSSLRGDVLQTNLLHVRLVTLPESDAEEKKWNNAVSE